LKTEENMFQTVWLSNPGGLLVMGNTMEIFFQTLADEFQDKSDLLEDLEEEVKYLPHPNTCLGHGSQPTDGNKCPTDS
jgi:hypothetical protein